MQAQQKFESPEIVFVKVFPFDQYRGKFAETDVLADESDGSWNDTTSGALFITVELKGPPSRVYSGLLGPGSKYSLRLVVTELGRGGKQLLNRARVLGVMGEQGRLFVSYLVEPSFCRAIRVVASVVGRGVQPAVERRATFACGE